MALHRMKIGTGEKARECVALTDDQADVFEAAGWKRIGEIKPAADADGDVPTDALPAAKTARKS